MGGKEFHLALNSIVPFFRGHSTNCTAACWLMAESFGDWFLFQRSKDQPQGKLDLPSSSNLWPVITPYSGWPSVRPGGFQIG